MKLQAGREKFTHHRSGQPGCLQAVHSAHGSGNATLQDCIPLWQGNPGLWLPGEGTALPACCNVFCDCWKSLLSQDELRTPNSPYCARILGIPCWENWFAGNCKEVEQKPVIFSSPQMLSLPSHLLITSGLETIFKNHQATTDPEAWRLFQKNFLILQGWRSS